jgi:hypothetical protein
VNYFDADGRIFGTGLSTGEFFGAVGSGLATGAGNVAYSAGTAPIRLGTTVLSGYEQIGGLIGDGLTGNSGFVDMASRPITTIQASGSVAVDMAVDIGRGIVAQAQTSEGLANLSTDLALGLLLGKIGPNLSGDPRTLSGHGAYNPSSGTTVIPKGTSLTVWTKHGNTILDELGQAIETGSEITYSQFGNDIVGATSYLPGAKVPNYTLFPGEGLNIMGNPTTVDMARNLSQLLSPNMGNVNWAACLEVTGGTIFNATLPWWVPSAAGMTGNRVIQQDPTGKYYKPE